MLYLASASPRRHELLNQADINHIVLEVPSPPGEDEPRLPDETPDDYVRRTAYEKAGRALYWLGLTVEGSQPDWPQSESSLPVYPVLAADTTVILQDDILGKPKDEIDAIQMLRQLSGQLHEVHTAVVLALPSTDGRIRYYNEVSRSQVQFKSLTAAEIAAYCASGEPKGKAGAYGIQGRAAKFVEHLSGSYSGVMGLPLYETTNLLMQAGIEP